jgi:hypothetical protein
MQGNISAPYAAQLADMQKAVAKANATRDDAASKLAQAYADQEAASVTLTQTQKALASANSTNSSAALRLTLANAAVKWASGNVTAANVALQDATKVKKVADAAVAKAQTGLDWASDPAVKVATAAALVTATANAKVRVTYMPSIKTCLHGSDIRRAWETRHLCAHTHMTIYLNDHIFIKCDWL